jgi:AraC-like DNA-binding protein
MILQALQQCRTEFGAGTRTVHVAPTPKRLYTPTPQMPCHAQPELFLQLSGENHFSFPGGKRRTLKKREACLVPAGFPHGERAVDTDEPFEMLVLTFPYNHLNLLYAVNRNSTPHPILMEQRQTEELRQTHALLHAIQNYRTPEQQRYAQHITAAVLGIVEHIYTHTPDPQSKSHTPPTLSQRCAALVQLHFSNKECNVDSLARQLGCTPNYLSAQFRRQTGERLSHYLLEQRLTHASDLLHDTTLTIAQVAACCGFSHPSYFIRRFKGERGCTPNVFRRQRCD